MNKTTQTIVIAAAVILTVAGTAVASSYFTRQTMQTSEAPAPAPKQAKATKPHNKQVAAAKPPCDDNNIVGTVGGAVAGGVIGNQFGKGSGRGLATAGGAVAGGALGNAYIPTRGATCN